MCLIEEIVEETFNEPSIEDPLGECFTQFRGDLDFDILLRQADVFTKPSLHDPLEECFIELL